MNSEHTKGPWTVKKTYCGNGEVEAGIYILRHNWDGLGSQNEMDANARLIAAAPDLLEALTLATDLVDRDVIRVRPSDRAELIAALTIWNAAISKAKSTEGEIE